MQNMLNGGIISVESALTTVDNPYDPITEYDKWNSWDRLRYGTEQYLARVCYSSHALSQSEQDHEYIRAMIEICEMNPTLYKIVTPK